MRRGRAEDETHARFDGRQRARVNDAALLLGLGARVGEKKALAADDGSFDHEEAAVFAGVDGVDLFVEWLLVEAGAVDEHRNDVWVAQAMAMVRTGNRVGGGVRSVVRRSGALARPFLLRLL